MKNQERKCISELFLYALSQLSVFVGLVLAAIFLPSSGTVAVFAAGGALFLCGLFSLLEERTLFGLVKTIFGAIVLVAATGLYFIFRRSAFMDILGTIFQCAAGLVFIALGLLSFFSENNSLCLYEIKKRYLFLLKVLGLVMAIALLIGIPLTVFLSEKFYFSAFIFIGSAIWLLRTVWYLYFMAKYKYSQEKIRQRAEMRKVLAEYAAAQYNADKY